MNSRRCLSLVLLAAAMLASSLAWAESVNVYSARKEQRIKPLLDQFTEETGIEVNLLTATSSSLIKRIELEGPNTPADVLITVDAGRLFFAKVIGVTQAIPSEVVKTEIPANLRDSDDHWVALSRRARPILYARSRVRENELSTYENLADSQWRGRLCLRSSNNVYNQSLVASMIEANGEEATLAWVQGLVSNLARQPQGGARNQILAVAEGECDITLVNSYYLALMLSSKVKRERRAAKRIGVFWPDQDGRGTHVNVSGIALVKHARHKDNAVRLIEFLLGEQAQLWYANANFEYPVTDVPHENRILSRWGDFKADPVSASRLGELNAEAVRLMQRGGWQ
ncbi:MAG: Fe(3+) ABC transporter substrate-binding protein [Gammaproteobacteria bacterium]|nr:MAG: Fe(3+) ABC transporter substrate-binding protein [Gammaproteobacteria bacterium]PIE37778.1 MAG: Fe(3+) ABC transporter substrate-binding protein [Gammaproteobacteria bacterium]